MSPVSERIALWEPEPVLESLLTETKDVPGEALELDQLLARGDVHSVYQPIVELDSGATVGYEALARGPHGRALERPDLLFAAARRAGRLSNLDRAGQTAAVSGTRAAGPPLRIADRGDLVSTEPPFSLGAALQQPRRSRKALLIEISKHLEHQAMSAGESTVVLASFQDASFFTPATRLRYAQLAKRAAFVGALGAGLPPRPLPGIRGCVLDPTDPLVGEWDIVVVGPHFAATLVARDLGDTGPDSERRFEFVLSHKRELAIQVALVLMSRMWPRPSDR